MGQRGRRGLTTELDGAGFFAFDSSKLNPGDILLSTVPLSPVSIAIRIGTWSRFSHAAICTNPPLFVEAIGVGVRPRSILGVGVKNKKWLRVLRLKTGITNWADYAREAAKHADRYLVHGYWLWGAFKTKLPGGSVTKCSELFCSHLVAQAYRDAGLDLVPGVAPSKVTPKAINRSPILRDISEEVLILTNDQDWPLKLDLTESVLKNHAGVYSILFRGDHISPFRHGFGIGKSCFNIILIMET